MLEAVVGSVLASVMTTAAIAWLARTWIAARLTQSIKYEYDQKLLELSTKLKAASDQQASMLKAEIDREADKLKFASASFGEVQKAAIAKKLEAVESVWAGMLALRARRHAILLFMDILIPSEYKDIKTMRSTRNIYAELNAEAEITESDKIRQNVETFRPYAGEYLWGLFATYFAIMGRMLYLVDSGKQDESKLNWHVENGIHQHMRVVFNDAELKEFDQLQVGRVNWIQSRFELRALAAMQTLITGHEFGSAALEQARQMELQLRKSS